MNGLKASRNVVVGAALSADVDAPTRALHILRRSWPAVNFIIVETTETPFRWEPSSGIGRTMANSVTQWSWSLKDDSPTWLETLKRTTGDRLAVNIGGAESNTGLLMVEFIFVELVRWR